MATHTHFNDEYEALYHGYTLVTLTPTSVQYMTFNRNNIIWHWPDDVAEDLQLEADPPGVLPFGLEFQLVNDSSVSQTFTAADIDYIVPANTAFVGKIMLKDGVKQFLATEYVPPV